MKKLGQIAIALFVLNNTLFDLIATAENVHLNIIFFSLMYFSLLLFCAKEFIDSNYQDYFGLLMGMGFAIRIILELCKWDLSWKEYLVSVSSFEQGLLFSFLTIAFLLIAISHARKH